jgi:hypothetical protein
MNITLWVIAGLLAFAVLAAGRTKPAPAQRAVRVRTGGSGQ